MADLATPQLFPVLCGAAGMIPSLHQTERNTVSGGGQRQLCSKLLSPLPFPLILVLSRLSQRPLAPMGVWTTLHVRVCPVSLSLVVYF